ncbi:MAG: hypothetical protein N4J56_001710 [Chroococcidiopsis sp. SAG 2025]|nr:hypothetical protein [Chroococcidiopsis sp. SAG 2025]MDV2992056.1 hypothetical protein [Chroococcidiopsis sp. SAG 2025]
MHSTKRDWQNQNKKHRQKFFYYKWKKSARLCVKRSYPDGNRLLVTLNIFDLTSSQPLTSATMSDSLKPNSNDRSLQRAFTNRIVDEYFDHTESWLRAILRMSVFSLTYIDGHSAMLIECPNQAVARRLSRKTTPLQQVVSYISSSYPYSHRVLICYQEAEQLSWRCFDTNTNTWKSWESLQTPTATSDQ